MSKSKKRGAGRPPRDKEIESFQTLAWFWSCMVFCKTSAPAELDAMFSAVDHGGLRSWQRYAKGKNTPSIIRKGHPGIAAKVGAQYPETLRVLNHPLWTALDTKQSLDTVETSRLLAQLDDRVTSQFLTFDDYGRPQRDWSGVEEIIWQFPTRSELIMDFLATYILLLREAQSQGRPKTIDVASIWIEATLEALPDCPFLGEFADQVEAMTRRTFFK